ncbi:hypothetical protein ACTXT7_015233 [Hymenolepis weldensis]
MIIIFPAPNISSMNKNITIGTPSKARYNKKEYRKEGEENAKMFYYLLKQNSDDFLESNDIDGEFT